jgi:beta-galactosidase
LATVLASPHLWDGQADPYLYSVRARTVVAGSVTDTVTIPLGLRFFSFDAQRGFSLNGHPLDLHGVNRHQDRPGKGWAISEADEAEDFALIEEIGATIVRQSHYQQSQMWNDLGDTRGMIMWAELPFTGPVEDDAGFFANAKEQLRELIRQNLQHPAIVCWSIGNETHNPQELPAGVNDRLLAELAQVVREEDDTRPSTYAVDGDANDSRAAHTDLIGFNYYAGWYHGAPEDFAAWIDRQHATHPAMRLGVSEYGAGANANQHEVPAKQPVPGGPWHPEEWQARQHEVYWQAMATRPWLWGKMIWCMFDFASDGRNEGGVPGRNDKGLVTADRRTRKDAFYWYEANWSPRPMVHITSARYTPRPAGSTTVKVYSNAEAVTLTVNGRALGERHAANHIFEWPDVVLAKGANHVEATARRDGEALRDACVWVGE